MRADALGKPATSSGDVTASVQTRPLEIQKWVVNAVVINASYVANFADGKNFGSI